MRRAGWCPVIATLVGCAPAAPPPVPPADRLVAAIEQDSVAAALRLLTDGADPDQPSSAGHLPLHEAVRLGRDSLVAELLASGANPAVPDGGGHTAYDLAMERETAAALDRLLVAAIRGAGGGEAVTAWMHSVAEGVDPGAPEWHEVLSGELLSLGLMYVALHGTPNQARRLRRAREMPNRTGYHALAVAARWGREPMVRMLLAIDVQPDLPTASPEGYTALTYARMGGHAAIVARLVAAGARSDI